MFSSKKRTYLFFSILIVALSSSLVYYEHNKYIEKSTEQESSRDLFLDNENRTYEELYKESSFNGTPLLLYFTSYASVEGRVMENSILCKERVVNRLKAEFSFNTLYIDSRSASNQGSIIVGDSCYHPIEKVGQIYLLLLEKKFKEQSTPFFVIIDSTGVVKATQKNTTNIEDFIEFLDKN